MGKYCCYSSNAHRMPALAVLTMTRGFLLDCFSSRHRNGPGCFMLQAAFSWRHECCSLMGLLSSSGATAMPRSRCIRRGLIGL